MLSEPLAMEGGRPHVPEGPPAWPPADPQVREALEAAYRDGSWGRYEGHYTGALTELIREWLAVEHVLLCASGTIAVEMALRGLGVGPGDEVILAAYDFSGNFRSVEAVGARPVLIDLEPEGWCLDVEQVVEAVSPATRVLLVSHLHGCLAPMRRVLDVARERDLLVLEDACQVPGAMIQGRRAGSWGDVGVFSFGGSKLLTAGRGGAVVTSRAEVAQRAKIYFERGNQAVPLSELQAAVLPPQLAKLDERNARRRANAERLVEACRDLRCLRPAAPRPDGETAYYKLPWRLDEESAGWERAALIRAVRAEGVALDEGFRGFVRRGSRRCRRVGELPRARRAAESTLLLHHPVLLEPAESIERVSAALHKVLWHRAGD